MALAPLVATLCLAIWAVTFLVTRYSSLASIVTAIALPVVAALFGEPWQTVVFAAIAGAGVIVLHRQNIRRLLNGTESRFSRTRAAGA